MPHTVVIQILPLIAHHSIVMEIVMVRTNHRYLTANLQQQTRVSILDVNLFLFKLRPSRVMLSIFNSRLFAYVFFTTFLICKYNY